jgi:hypothetical protein
MASYPNKWFNYHSIHSLLLLSFNIQA